MRITEPFEAFVGSTIISTELAFGTTVVITELSAIRLADVGGSGRCFDIVEFATFGPVFCFRI